MEKAYKNFMEKAYKNLEQKYQREIAELNRNGIYLKGRMIDQEKRVSSVGGLYKSLLTHIEDIKSGRKHSKFVGTIKMSN